MAQAIAMEISFPGCVELIRRNKSREGIQIQIQTEIVTDRVILNVSVISTRSFQFGAVML